MGDQKFKVILDYIVNLESAKTSKQTENRILSGLPEVSLEHHLS